MPMLPGELRDYREKRDWRRPWRDPPGFFGCCHCSSAPSSPSNPIVSTCSGNGCPLPATLHVTFANSGSCAAVDGQTFAINFVDEAHGWTGQFSFGSPGSPCVFSIVFLCLFGTPTPPLCGTTKGCQVYALSLQEIGASGNAKCALAGCTCSPINLSFSNITFAFAGGNLCSTRCLTATGLSATVTQ